MHSVKLTTANFKKLTVLFSATLFFLNVFAQENSPYSRYGLGDVIPNHSISSRGMGGIAAGLADYQNINFTNPSTLNKVRYTTFDIGTEADFRTLKSKIPAKKFLSANALFSYIQLAFPVSTEKMKRRNINWGMNFGLKPVSRVNYKIESTSKIIGVDSVATLYEGTGGVNQAFVGTGFKIKNLSFGLTAGYLFGNKNYSTKRTVIDTVEYYKSNSENSTTFNGILINAGFQYDIKIKKSTLRIGAYGNLGQKLNAKQDLIRETFAANSTTGQTFRIDSVFEQKGIKGKIELPATFGVGFTYEVDEHLTFGIDYENTGWNKYRYYGQADAVQNNWTVRGGAQYYPGQKGNSIKKSYLNYVQYRAGFYYGPDYIKVNQNRSEFAVSIGAGFPLTSAIQARIGNAVFLNTAIEIGSRGNKTGNVKENFTRVSVGLCMGSLWFRKNKYD
jgi:hypothetical protein